MPQLKTKSRVIYSVKVDNRSARVYSVEGTEDKGYRVKFFVDGNYRRKCDRYTLSKKDAFNIAHTIEDNREIYHHNSS